MSDRRRLLHDPSRERDACGIGLVADARGRASRELLDRALAGLAAVGHRGAWAADGVTGDGAGVLLGPHGRNLGAGITGGECFLLDADPRLVNDELVALVELEREEEERLLRLLERHARATGSSRAAVLLADPAASLPRFRRIAPGTQLAQPSGIERKMSA